jgi:hypothetical protein
VVITRASNNNITCQITGGKVIDTQTQHTKDKLIKPRNPPDPSHLRQMNNIALDKSAYNVFVGQEQALAHEKSLSVRYAATHAATRKLLFSDPLLHLG